MKKKTYLMIAVPLQIVFVLVGVLIMYKTSVCGLGFNTETNEIVIGTESLYGHNVAIYNEDNSLKSFFEINTRGGFKLQVASNQIEINTNGDNCRMLFDFNGNLLSKEFETLRNEISLKINEPIQKFWQSN